MSIKSKIVEMPPVIDWQSLPLMLDEKQAVAVLGAQVVSLSFLRKSRSEGTRKNRTPAPPHIKLGGRVSYRVADLIAWVEGLKAREAV